MKRTYETFAYPLYGNNILINNFTAKNVINVVLDVTELSRSELFSSSRISRCVYARHIISHILREELNWRIEAIGKLLKRHHATIMHSFQMYNELKNDAEFSRYVLEVKKRLQYC